MKTLAVASALIAATTCAMSQGTVLVNNSSTTLVRTNGGIPFVGDTSPAPNGFYYELLTAPSSVTTVSSFQALLSAPWSDTGISATNTASAGRLRAGSSSIASFWPEGQMESFVLVGWSSDWGSTWSALAAKLSGSDLTFSGGAWTTGSGGPFGSWLGISSVGFGEAGGESLPAFSVFGSNPTSQGTPIAGFDLYPITPEPGSANLAALGLILAGSNWLRRSRR
jgi:hypothetical protein